MKLLRVIASTHPASGGPIEGLRQITPHLAARGHLTEVACLEPAGADWHSQLGVPVHALGPAAGTYGYTSRLIPWLRTHGPRFDAVVVHGLWQFHGLAVRQALAGRVPYVVYPHGMLDPWFKRRYPLKHLKKAVYWPLGDYRVLRDARAVLFTTEEEKLLAAESFRPYRLNAQVINYGTAGPGPEAPGSAARFVARFPALEGKRVIGFLGRLHEKKGCDLLIAAFARAAAQDPQLHLVLAGPDQTGWRATLEQLAAQAGLAERITWPGLLAGEEKWDALRAFEVFVLPSHQENFGIAVAESLACGTPVLISDKVNIWREIARDGAGLVAPDTRAGTATLLERWLARSESERRETAAQARACFERRFSIERAVESFEAVLATACLGGVA